jgi:hypothetical protein
MSIKSRAGRSLPPIRRVLEQRDHLAAEVAALTDEVASLTGEAAALTGEVAALTGEVAALTDEVGSLTVEVGSLTDEVGPLRELPWPPGHYYSPFPSLDEVRQRRKQIFDRDDDLLEVDVADTAQRQLVRTLAPFANEATFPEVASEGYRYYFENDFFGHGDAIALHSVLRWLRPKRIIEIGSGHSSALILDTNERNLNGEMHCTFIEPYPDRLKSLLRFGDQSHADIVASPLQDVTKDVIGNLEEGDVLFVDSSHVSKVGSDVNLLIFEVLPRLPAGVFVHFHDIFYPFDYPEPWVLEGRGWNEAYILRSYLQANAGYRIRLWNHYLATFHRSEVAQQWPMWDRNPGGSIWLERL